MAKIRLDEIKKDIDLSPRIDTGVNPETAEDYSNCFDQLPPIAVYKVESEKKYILTDGWHRCRAAEILGLVEIEADVRYGTSAEAREHALLSNLRHGRPLTRKEKRHVVEEFLKLHPEHTNKWIADDLGTNDRLVARVREELERKSIISTFEMLIARDGREYPRTIEQPKQSTEEESEEEIESEPDLEPAPVIPMLGPYELNQVHNIDCVQGLMALPESSIDLAFADPPYNLGVRYGENHNDSLPPEEYYHWCLQWFMGCYHALKTGGALYVMHYPEVAARWKQQLDGLFTFQRWISWVYPSNIGHKNGNWRRSHRTVLYYTKGQVAYFDGEADPQPYKNPNDRRVKHLGKEGTTPYDWWEIDLVKNVSKDKTEWPNQLPIDLVRRVVVSSSPKGGIVCDPFMGSGTTAEAAWLTERQWIGFDVQPEACEVTRSRLDGKPLQKLLPEIER